MADNKEKYFENEKLDPEQLDEVSGGSCKELSEDSRVLKSLGLCGFYDQMDLKKSPGQCQEVIKAWAQGGVTVRTSKNFPNQYFINGQKVSRLMAVDYVKKNH